MEKDRRKMGWITRGTLMIDGRVEAEVARKKGSGGAGRSGFVDR